MRGTTLALVFMVLVRGGSDVDRDFTGGEKGLHDEGGNGGNERSHDRPFGVLGLATLDLPRGRDYHRERSEVGDAGQDAHASTDGGVQGARLGEKEAAAVEKVGGSEKVRIHGYDCTMTRENSGTGYVPSMSYYEQGMSGLLIFGQI